MMLDRLVLLQFNEEVNSFNKQNIFTAFVVFTDEIAAFLYENLLFYVNIAFSLMW